MSRRRLPTSRGLFSVVHLLAPLVDFEDRLSNRLLQLLAPLDQVAAIFYKIPAMFNEELQLLSLSLSLSL
jgi:hypothetical protein